MKKRFLILSLMALPALGCLLFPNPIDADGEKPAGEKVAATSLAWIPRSEINWSLGTAQQTGRQLTYFWEEQAKAQL